MTGNDIYLKARTVLGAEAVGIDRNNEVAFKKEVVKMLGLLADDMEIEFTQQSLDTEIICSKSQEQALVFGLAMYICVALGLAERHNYFKGLYASHRTHAKSTFKSVSDVLPRGEG